ncbi:MAG: DUF1343 domain-containing protein [Clostridia bacterium]|nr:DUF1343 domain-containing protein [Clostridia bacterium]
MEYRHGLEQLDEAKETIRGRRLGLITNCTGLDQGFRRSVDLVREQLPLARLFAPEHGLDGVRQAGEHFESSVDPASGLEVVSLFKKGNRSGNDAVFEDLDGILYDIQDVGLRFFTYISVLGIAMGYCKKRGIPMTVLDRYNPLGLERMEGTLLDERFSSFVGAYGIPSRYAMTVGEYARFINEEKGIGCELNVIPCRGLSRRDDHETLGLPWVSPSPNLPTYESALIYTGTVLFEGTTLSEGRGTTKPFEIIGAPWLRGEELAERMNGHGLEGVVFRATAFIPVFSKYKGIPCYGVQLHVTDKARFEPFLAAMLLLEECRRYPEFEFKPSMTRLLGTEEYLLPDFNARSFCERHAEKIRRFRPEIERYRLYE